jgi:hypothetical protein
VGPRTTSYIKIQPPVQADRIPVRMAYRGVGGNSRLMAEHLSSTLVACLVSYVFCGISRGEEKVTLW